MKITACFAFCMLLWGSVATSQVKFDVSLQGMYIIKDSVNDVVYSFDTGAESSNLFNKEKFDYNFGGITLITNATGKPKFIKKARIRQKFSGLGEISTNANILGDKKFKDAHCIDFDILLGAKTMKKHMLHFNNREKTLSELSGLPADIARYQKLELTSGYLDGRYYITLDINGKKEKLLVDTAFTGGILINSDKHLKTKDDEYSLLALMAFRTETETVERYKDNEVKHNGVALKNDLVYYNSMYSNIVGNYFFLSYDEVIFDLKNKSVYVLNEKPQQKVFEGDVFFTPTDESDFIINFVKHSGSYYSSGFRVGDKITLKDKELEKQLLASPCDTYKIIMDWQKQHGAFPEFSKI